MISAQQGSNSSVVFDIHNLYENYATTFCDGSPGPDGTDPLLINEFAGSLWQSCHWGVAGLASNTDTNYDVLLTVTNWQKFPLQPGEGGLAARATCSGLAYPGVPGSNLWATFEIWVVK